MIKQTIAEYIRIVSLSLTTTPKTLRQLLVAAGFDETKWPRAVGNTSQQGSSLIGANFVVSGANALLVTGNSPNATGTVSVPVNGERVYWSIQVADELLLNTVGGSSTVVVELYFG
jgi:hypothetical protein